MFLKLYRGDMLLAAFMRNFIFASRLLEPLGIYPVSYPNLPKKIKTHNLWYLWDYHFKRTMNYVLNQNINYKNLQINRLNDDFFDNQLFLFENWLKINGTYFSSPSEYLPQALQVFKFFKINNLVFAWTISS